MNKYINNDVQKAIITAVSTLTETCESVSKDRLNKWMGRPYFLQDNLDALVASNQIKIAVVGICDTDIRISLTK